MCVNIWFGLTLHIVSHFTITSNLINCIMLTGLNPSTPGLSVYNVNIMQSQGEFPNGHCHKQTLFLFWRGGVVLTLLQHVIVTPLPLSPLSSPSTINIFNFGQDFTFSKCLCQKYLPLKYSSLFGCNANASQPYVYYHLTKQCNGELCVCGVGGYVNWHSAMGNCVWGDR